MSVPLHEVFLSEDCVNESNSQKRTTNVNVVLSFQELEKREKELESDIEEIEQKTPSSIQKLKKLKSKSKLNALSPSSSRFVFSSCHYLSELVLDF